MVQAGETSHAEAWQSEDTRARRPGRRALRQEVGISRDPSLTSHFSICFPPMKWGDPNRTNPWGHGGY